jgi:iron complex transport system substrate-binding protein
VQRRSLLLTALVAVTEAGCSARLGNKSEQRLVSTSPSMTEAVFALGRGAKLVGRSSFCDYPAEALAVETIGGFADPNLEKVLSLKPSLVIGERGPAGPEFVDRLTSYGIETFFPQMDSVEQIVAALSTLGGRIGADEEARTLTAKLAADLAEISRLVKPLREERAVLLFDWKPLIAAGPGTFPDELLRAAGASNPVTGSGKYPKLAAEGLLALDPDVIIDGSGGAYSESALELLASVPGLTSLRAAKNKRVYRLQSAAALRPGPRVAQGVRELAALLHPELAQP